jgi:hypothetical protein
MAMFFFPSGTMAFTLVLIYSILIYSVAVSCTPRPGSTHPSVSMTYSLLNLSGQQFAVAHSLSVSTYPRLYLFFTSLAPSLSPLPITFSFVNL